MAVAVSTGVRPGSSSSDEQRTAALVSLEAEDVETISLLLNILGWRWVAVSDFDQTSLAEFHLIVMSSAVIPVFLNEARHARAGAVKCIVVEHDSQEAIRLALGSGFACLVRPIDVSELESLIVSAT